MVKNESELKVVSQLKNNTYICVTLKPHGVNGLFDFYNIGKIEADSLINAEVLNEKTIIDIATDIHSPYKIRSVANKDGDNPDVEAFTGGCHGYNGDQTGTATARLDSLVILLNNIELKENGTYYGNELTMKWVNYIQGYNTKKADGTGREIIAEHHHMTFDGKEWKTENTIECLEEIVIVCLYGLQMKFIKDTTKIQYIGGTNRAVYNANVNSKSGAEIPNGIIAKDTTNDIKITLEMDTTFDIGKGTYYDNNDISKGGAFCPATDKAYMYLADWLNGKANEFYCYRGIYKIEPCEY